ncbi:hypothetical protein HQ545_00740 [Candidatus Woesearchaeota archaeon]|nr:hypothetical protein [Candidatus Woesearchaeota archaeon]
MKCIRVNVNKIEVDDFSVRDGAHLSIFFDDGGKKCLKYSTQLSNIDEDVKNILIKIQVYEKSQNKVLDADDVLDGFISVLVENEEEVMCKMNTFLCRLKDEHSRLKSHGSHSGYMEALNRMQKKCLEIKPKTIRNI